MSLNRKTICAVAGILSATMLTAGAVSTEQKTMTIPVTLTVVNTVNTIDVTLPASFPVSVLDGKVLTATNVDIRNNSTKSKIEITDVRIVDGAYKVVKYDTFQSGTTGEIAMSLNGCSTQGSGSIPLTKEAFPIIDVETTLPVNYKAKVTAKGETTKLNAANVIITLRAISL